MKILFLFLFLLEKIIIASSPNRHIPDRLPGEAEGQGEPAGQQPR
jgi:hypothetical protein